MPATQTQAKATIWNRKVDVDSTGKLLIISTMGKNPPPPNPNPRTDTDLVIDVFKNDRNDGGAKIFYHAGPKVNLTGIALKVGSDNPDGHLEVEPNAQDPDGTNPGPGKLMKLTVTKASGNGSVDETWHYFIQGTVDNGTIIQTVDPTIRNRAE